MANLAGMLTETAAEHGERTAIKLDDVQIPYAVLEQGTRYAAGLLAAKGIGPGDRAS
jgi:long-chain acyl-CoA synthetase